MASILPKKQEMVPKCSLWIGFTQRGGVWIAFFTCKPMDDRQNMEDNQLELRQWKVHLPVIDKYYFPVIFQRLLPNHFSTYLKVQLLYKGLKISPSVYVTDFTLQFYQCCCNTNLHGPFSCLSCCYMLSNALRIEYFPDENSCNLTEVPFYPVSLNQSKLWWVWFR